VFADSHPPPRSDSASLLSRAQVPGEVLQLHGTEREGAQEGGRGGWRETSALSQAKTRTAKRVTISPCRTFLFCSRWNSRHR